MGKAEGDRSIATLQEGGEEMSKESVKGLATFNQDGIEAGVIVKRADVRVVLYHHLCCFSFAVAEGRVRSLDARRFRLAVL